VTVESTASWHHGLVADRWAEFNKDGPEIEYFGDHRRESATADTDFLVSIAERR
jgi:hypothetical protein